MKTSKLLTCVAAAALAAAISTASAQTPVRIRGTITAVDANTLNVKSREGKDLQLALPDNATVSVTKAAAFTELKEGDYVGTTTRPGPDGSEVAVEVHYIPPTANAGQTPSDLSPGSKMTNANVQAKVTGVGNHELMLQFAGKTQKVIVPDGTPIVRSVPGVRADLKVGEYVLITAQAAGDGALTALRIQVSKDGVRPPN